MQEGWAAKLASCWWVVGRWSSLTGHCRAGLQVSCLFCCWRTGLGEAGGIRAGE